MVGVIPDNRDSSLTETYKQDPEFWDKTARWKEKGWELALHGCYHKYTTEEGGINPVNKRSEFAGVPLDKQKEMIRHGVDILKSHNIEPKVFFAPSHTFDENTLIALKEESNIRIISDTIANDVYLENGFYFIIRVKLVCNWVDKDGNVSATPVPAPTITNSDWFEKDGIYYYKMPVALNGETSNLLKDHPITQGEAPEGCHLEVTVLAESIQAAPSTAVEGAWAVTVVNGALTSATPTA